MTGISELLLDAGAASESIKPADFDAFQKSIAMLVKATRPRYINIQDSKLLAKDAYGRAIYEIDFSNIFSSPVSMAFLITKEELQALEGLGGNSDISLMEVDAHFFLAGESGLAALKKYRGTAPRISAPDLGNAQLGDTVHFTIKDSVLRGIKKAKWVGLLTHEKQLTGYAIQDSTLQLFSAESGPDVVGKSPDAIYKSVSFLKLAGSFADLSIFDLNGQTWLKTVTNIGKPTKGGTTNDIGPTITIYERLLPASMADFQRLFSVLSRTN